jgi:hypothetical protein
LPSADISIKLVGTLLDDMNAQERSPGMANQNNLVLMQIASEIFR